MNISSSRFSCQELGRRFTRRQAMSSSMKMGSGLDFWQAFSDELDRWAQAGTSATFWWRDDDTSEPTETLSRLLGLGARNSVCIGVAVIPARLSPALADTLCGHPSVAVLQHGYAHVNHAPRGQNQGAWELGLHRSKAQVLDEIRRGGERLRAAFGGSFLPVVAPPWNHISEALFPDLVELGYFGVSAAGVRPALEPVPGLRMFNIHCDLLKWKKTEAAFRGEEKIREQLLGHVRARREGIVDEQEPTGVLTHHLMLDDAAWQFLERMVNVVNAHCAARWVTPAELFRPRKDPDTRASSEVPEPTSREGGS